MSNKIEIFEHTLLKLLTRNGLDSDRKNIKLDQGELGFTTDTERLFCGNGVDNGGILIGNKFLGQNVDITSLSPGELGDTAFDLNTNSLYTINVNDGSLLTDWDLIGRVLIAGDGTIVIDTDGSTSVGTLSAGNFSDDAVGTSLEVDVNNRLDIAGTISIDQIVNRGTGYLLLPEKISINSVEYKFPGSTPNAGEYLGARGGEDLVWDIPGVLLTAVPSTTANMIPIGTIVQFISGAAAVPYGWLPCDGRLVDELVYADLFALIGSTYGTDGGGNFNLPDYTDNALYGSDDPSAATNLQFETVVSASASLSASGALFIIRAIAEISNPTLKVESPLSVTLSGVDVTDTVFNPLDGDVVISSRPTITTTTTLSTTLSSGVSGSIVVVVPVTDPRSDAPGMETFDTAGFHVFNIPAGIRSVKFHVTGTGAGGKNRSGNSSSTIVGYITGAPGEAFTVKVGAAPASHTASGTSSYIQISAVILAEAFGGVRGETAPTLGTLNTGDAHVSSGYIIPGGIGFIDTNDRDEESLGASSFWGSAPAPGAGGGGEDRNDRLGTQFLPGPGIVMFEWS